MTKPGPRVLFASYSRLLGGAERVLLDCATGMDSAAVACPDGPLAQAARDQGLTVVLLGARSLEFRRTVRDRVAAPARMAAQAKELRAAVRLQRPAVLFGWNMRGLLVSALALRGLRPRPALVFQHNDLLPPDRAVASIVRAAALLSQRVVCLSRAIVEDLDPDGRLSERVRIVHPGVDLSRFTPGPPPGGANALCLGAIVAWKRPDLALEIASRAASTLPDFRLRLAGAPLDHAGQRLFTALQRRAEQPDLRSRVRLEGATPDPAEALRQAGCLLHCADREPFGLALVEALACGVPVVAPDSAGPREIVDPTCGLLYPPGDAAAGAAAVREVLSAPGRRAELSAGARARAERLFDRNRTRAAYRELVGQLSG